MFRMSPAFSTLCPGCRGRPRGSRDAAGVLVARYPIVAEVAPAQSVRCTTYSMTARPPPCAIRATAPQMLGPARGDAVGKLRPVSVTPQVDVLDLHIGVGRPGSDNRKSMRLFSPYVARAGSAVAPERSRSAPPPAPRPRCGWARRCRSRPCDARQAPPAASRISASCGGRRWAPARRACPARQTHHRAGIGAMGRHLAPVLQQRHPPGSVCSDGPARGQKGV
jgi:hypothetical protein